MIIQVIWEISGFLILLGYSILAFTFLFLMAQGETFDLKLQESFLIALEDFNLDEMNFIRKLLFIFASIFNLIIMLNLLISIIGETFDRV